MSGSYLYKWLFGAKRFLGAFEKRTRGIVTSTSQTCFFSTTVMSDLLLLLSLLLLFVVVVLVVIIIIIIIIIIITMYYYCYCLLSSVHQVSQLSKDLGILGVIAWDMCPGWGGGGALNKVLYGEALPQGPTPYPFICQF